MLHMVQRQWNNYVTNHFITINLVSDQLALWLESFLRDLAECPHLVLITEFVFNVYIICFFSNSSITVCMSNVCSHLLVEVLLDVWTDTECPKCKLHSAHWSWLSNKVNVWHIQRDTLSYWSLCYLRVTNQSFPYRDRLWRLLTALVYLLRKLRFEIHVYGYIL